jgi:hypothetical protein
VTSPELEKKLPVYLPEGFRIVSARYLGAGAPRLSDFDLLSTYSIRPPAESGYPGDFTKEKVDEAWRAFLAAPEFTIAVTREESRKEIDIKSLVTKLEMNAGELYITIIHGTGRGVRPLDAASAILGVQLPPDRFVPRKISAEPFPRKKK